MSGVVRQHGEGALGQTDIVGNAIANRDDPFQEGVIEP